jgi:hypothetical protein
MIAATIDPMWAAAFIALDVLGVGSDAQRIFSAALLLGVAFALNDREASKPVSPDDSVASEPSPEDTCRRCHVSKRSDSIDRLLRHTAPGSCDWRRPWQGGNPLVADDSLRLARDPF